jgi:transmembrane sensor
VRLLNESDDLVSFSLEAGKGWFEVTPSETRRVEVQIEDVRVQVLGTEFVVELEGDIVHVWVHRGKVLVTSDGRQVTVTSGDHQRFPAKNKRRDESKEPVDKDVVPNPIPVKKPKNVPLPLPPVAVEKTEPTLPVDVETRDEDATLPAPVVEPKPVPTADRVAELWKRADAGRRTGDKDKAISALTELLGKHNDDPRAALAAFTLGRVLIDANRSPVVAARAFADARKLAPAGPLVEDALLREIEAWFEAGDTRRVQKRSEKYYRLFPKGRYLKQVRELGSAL